jgi:two-component system LytT family response regulator
MSILNQSIKKIGELEGLVLKTKDVLVEMMEKQTALDVHFQELKKHQEIHKIAINSATRIDFVIVDEIIFCKANLACTEIITFNDNNLTARKSLNDFEIQLSNESFIRISKSLLINVNHIHSFNKKTSQVTMKDNSTLDVARRRKTSFIAKILAK